MALNFPIVTSVQPTDYVRVILNPGTLQSQDAQITVENLLTSVPMPGVLAALTSAAPATGESPPVTDYLTVLLQGFWGMEEPTGNRYSAYGESHFIEQGGAQAIGTTPGRAGIGLAADFSGVVFRWLVTTLPALEWADMGVSFHAKMDLPVGDCAVISLAPSQTTRRAAQMNGPGNFISIGVTKVGADYRFSAYMGTISQFGGAEHWHIVSSVNISANTYYHVLVYAETLFETGARTINISVNNTLTSLPTPGGQFRHHAPTLIVGDNPLRIGHQGAATNLAVDNLAVWYGRSFTASQRAILYNEGRGWDPTRSFISGDNLLAFWPMDEAAGLTRADLLGRYSLLDPNGAVAQAEGTHEEAADFAGATTSFLHTKAPLYDWRGIAVAGFVKFDSVGVTRPMQLLIDWLAGDEAIHGFRLYYADGDGFVFEIGNGTGTTVKVETGDSPEIVADQWYFVAAGATYQGFGGTIWVARDAAAPVSLTSFPSPHNMEAFNLFFGRDVQGSDGTALDGKMDCWGMYRALSSNDLSIIRQYKCYPF